MKTIAAIVTRSFSNTIFGNVEPGDRLNISRDRFNAWKEQGLVKSAEKTMADINKMTKDQLEAYAREKFDIELDKRLSIVKLRKDVQALLDVMNDG